MIKYLVIKSRYMSRVYLHYIGGHKSIMKHFAPFKEHPWMPICFLALAALFSVGCTSSRSKSGAIENPLAAYDTTTGINSSTYTGTIIGDGNTIIPGSLNSPVITVQEDGSTSINGHDNAPLLDNKHPGWQQSSCLTCHNDTTHNPDHNYSDDSLCYLCHGTNGLPGLSDTTPPVLSSVVVSPTENSVTISWKSDKDCVSRLVLKTTAGDKMEFPVSSTYTTSHKKTVSGLQSSTSYYYELICIDKSGNKTSTSSFSSVLMFQTPAQTVTPVITTPTEEEETTEEDVDSFFSGIKVEDKGAGHFYISFRTREKPDTLWFYMYKDKACKEEIDHDDITPNNTNVYTNFDVDSGQQPGNYYVKLFATRTGAESKWSKAYKVKLAK